MTFKRVVRQGNRSPSRQVAWASLVSTSATAVPGSSAVLLASFTSAALVDGGLSPGTLIRVRGLLTVYSDQIAANEIWHGAIGLAVVSDAARAAGIASLPTPITEANTDFWQTWRPYGGRFSFITGAGFEAQGATNYEIDSKAMRKIKPGDAIVLVAEQGAAVGSDLIVDMRLLFKYH